MHNKLECNFKISKQLVTEMISLLNVICSFAVCLEHHPSLSPFQHFNSLGILKNKNSTFSCGGPRPNQSPWWPGPPALTSRHFAHWGNLLPSRTWGAADILRGPVTQQRVRDCFRFHHEFCLDCRQLDVAVQIVRLENLSE